MLLKNKIEIQDWLKKYGIKNYELILDDEYGYVVNVYRDVNLYKNDLKNIDVKFNTVYGNFNCFGNKIESLEENTDKSVGCPNFIGGYFNCSDNKLKSLNEYPKKINGNYICLINNPDLEDFNEIKKTLSIIKEKTNLIKVVEKESTDLIRKVIEKIIKI